jgi:hypothetical protein
MEEAIMLKILQINYKLTTPAADFLANAVPAARAISEVSGLRWKIWLKSETENEGGGIYLFEDEAALEAFLSGPIVEKLKSHPALREISVKKFDVAADLTELTRGPVQIEDFA